MQLRKKLKITLVFALVCLILMVATSYAWLVLSLRPEVNNIATNIGANGSLEIALLTEKTYADPLLIRASVGDSAAAMDAVEANNSWGNVIELSDARYGLSKIVLTPARLNVIDSEGEYSVGSNLLKTAEFGVDGRMTVLSDATVSTILSEDAFTYYVDRQLYGVRAIGTISNLTPQQTALAYSRTAVKSYTAAASRVMKHTWRDQGAGIMDILYRRYSDGAETFTAADVAAIRAYATGMQTVLGYVESALRQGMIGVAATRIADEAEFETLTGLLNNTSIPLSALLATVGNALPSFEYLEWGKSIDQMKLELTKTVASSYALMNGGSWTQIEPLLDVLLDADKAYLGEKKLSDSNAYADMTGENVITVVPGSGMMATMAAYAGNYSTFTIWNTINIEARSADPSDIPYLLLLEQFLEEGKAATGGWTRSNLDYVFGFTVDLAFRCNEESELLLQTTAAFRAEENTEFPVTQGGGSYMRFSSDNMDIHQLVQLMDTIRIAFLNDKGTILGIAKLNITNYEEQEDGVTAPLYLYEFELEENGSLTIGERRSQNPSILTLAQNSPAVVTAVVWLDGDHVDNSLVGNLDQNSMEGVLNLQFSSSADLISSGETLKVG